MIKVGKYYNIIGFELGWAYLFVPVITSKSLVTATMSGTLFDGNMSSVSSSSTKTDGGISSV